MRDVNLNRLIPGRGIRLLGVVALALGMSGCNSGSDNESAETITPFERVAVLPVVTGEGGVVDYEATYVKAADVAKTIRTYIEGTDDTLEENGGLPANWIIGGQDNNPATEEGILDIPSMEYIIPDDNTSGTYKVFVMDICNSYYAQKALGVSDIIAGQKVADGYIHAPALPCEIAVYNDGEGIYVDMTIT